MTSNFDVYAKWSALQYSIIYYYESERITTLNPKSYTIEDAVTLPTYSVYNHTFNGWYSDSALTNRVNNIPAGSTGTVKLYAKLTDNGFTVNFYDTNKTTLLDTKTTTTYGSVTAPTYSYDTATYILKWVDKATNEVVDLTEIDNNYNVYADLIVISYTATVYYVDADGYSTAKTGSPIITSKTISSINYGTSINLTRQMRVTDTSTYDYFYMSQISAFDWSLVVTSLATGTAKLSSDNTCSCYATVDGTTGNIRIYVFCIQAVAIITSSSQTLSFEQNLDMSTSTYQFYSTIDSAFEAFSTQSSKLMRIYGRATASATKPLESNCLGNTSNVTIASATATVDGVSITRPQLVYKYSDYTLHNSYTLTSGKIILPYSRKCTDTTGYRLKNTAANSTGHIHSLLAIDKDVTLTLSIDFVIGGDIVSGSSLYGRAVVMNNGTIIVNSTKTIYSYGYLKGTGNVIANAGATLIDYFYVYGWPGGANAYGLYNKDVFPFHSYSFHNISCNTRIYAGATLRAWCQLYMADTWVAKDMVMVGSGGLFQLTSGYIDKSIKETTSTLGTNTNYASSNQNQTVKDVLDIHGNFTDNSISIEVTVLGTQTVSTSTAMALPIGFMEIKISEGDGTLSKNSYKFLPGSKLTIEKLGSLTINSGVKVIFYDEYPDNYSYTDTDGSVKSGLANPYSYQKLHSAIYTDGAINDGYHAELTVNGLLVVKGNLGGNIYTTSSTGSINLSNTSATIPKVATLKYAKLGGTATVTDETITAKIYLLSGETFAWTNASATTYSSVEHNGEFGFIQNTSVHSFTITYNYGGHTSSTTIHSTDSTYVIESSDLFDVELDGYTFNDWYINQTYTTLALGYEITSDINLYASLTAIIYNIDYQALIVDDYDGEAIINHNPTYFTVEDNVSLIPAVCGDLTFYGWFVDEDYSISAPGINSSTLQYYKMVMDGNTIHLYGYFSSVARYSIVYRDQQGLVIDSIPSQQIDGGQSITLADAMPDYQTTDDIDTSLFAYDLYRFSKWQVVSSTGTPIGQFNAGATYTPTSSIIVIPVYTKVATYVSITPGALSNASYTASFTGGSGTSNATFYVAVGTSVKFTVSYSYSDNKTFTYTPASGSATSNTTVTASYNAVVSASSEDGGCLAEGTLITMYDGSLKNIEDIVVGDIVVVWDNKTNSFITAKVNAIWNHGFTYYSTIEAQFGNETIKIVNNHAFYDLTLNDYVIINSTNYANYIGHEFALYNNGTLTSVTLNNATVRYELSGCYSLMTEGYNNFISNNLVSRTPDPFDNFFNIFEEMFEDQEQLEQDIATYGLYTYEEWQDYISLELFEAYHAAYFKILVGKGIITVEEIMILIQKYA